MGNYGQCTVYTDITWKQWVTMDNVVYRHYMETMGNYGQCTVYTDITWNDNHDIFQMKWHFLISR